MRQFIRHPAEIPLQVSSLEAHLEHRPEQLKDICNGGLSFHSDIPLQPGDRVNVHIDLTSPAFTAVGRVVWCKALDAHYDVGVRFEAGSDTDFNLRMAEQVCHIVQYWHDEMRSGRRLSIETAAAEWIENKAADFPH